MMRSVFVAATIAVLSMAMTGASAAQVYDYTITAAEPLANIRYGDGEPCAIGAAPQGYVTVPVTVTTGGVYTLTDSGGNNFGADGGAAIYSAFNPAAPGTDCLGSVDGSQTVTLAPGAYTLVLANWQSSDYKAFQLTVTGPAPLASSTPTSVPTLSEWALILFGTILAGGAALYIQRRRPIV